MNARAVAAETPGGPRLLLLAERLGPFRVCFPEAPLVRGCLVLVDTPDTRRALEALGVPITQHDAMSGFDWAGAPVMAHQRDTVTGMLAHQRVPILNDIGTGKTLCALLAFEYLRRRGLAKRMLVLATNSTMHAAWGHEVFKWMSGVGMRADVLSGPGPKRLKKLAESSAHVHIVNHDGFSRVAGLAEAMVGGYDILCVDEATAYKNVQSARHKHLYRWTELAEHRDLRMWLMTGTPTPNSPMDAWALARLLRSPHTPIYMSHARDWLMRQIPRTEIWVNRPEAPERVAKMLVNAVRFRREDCFDLPPTTYATQAVELTEQQERLLVRLERQGVAELETGGVVAGPNPGVVMQRMLQISGGAAYTSEGVVKVITQARIAALKAVVEQSSHKVLVFTPWLGVLSTIVDAFGKDELAVVNGSVSVSARREIFRAFQEDDKPRVLAAVPQAMSHGLTLTAAGTIVWYSPPFSNETYEQANGRIERLGKVSGHVVHLVASDLERKVFSRLKARQRVQDSVNELVAERSRG